MTPTLTILNTDNLDALRQLEQDGARFDLVECDGPYMAGLEEWDNLTEDQYVAHYADRLSIVARLLQPWGVVFVFGYPEGCAEIKTWSRQTGTLHLRRWLTWYKQRTAHKGRKVETIAVFIREQPSRDRLIAFGRVTQRARREMGLSREEVGRRIEGVITGRIGQGLHERPEGKYFPTPDIFYPLCNFYGLDAEKWLSIVDYNYASLTNLDYLSATYPEDTHDLNDAGLRSKPVGLYLDLFRPTIPPRETKRALILYGGSGNAAFAAGRLGYDVTLIERDPARCEAIRRRWAWQIERRDETPAADLGPLFQGVAA